MTQGRSPYMTTLEVAELLRFTVTSKTPLVSAWKWIRRRQLRCYPVGRELRVLRAAVEAELREAAETRERRLGQRQLARHRARFAQSSVNAGVM